MLTDTLGRVDRALRLYLAQHAENRRAVNVSERERSDHLEDIPPQRLLDLLDLNGRPARFLRFMPSRASGGVRSHLALAFLQARVAVVTK